MSTWFTPSDETRLLNAWRDAPVENQEVLGFILESARIQVLDYAPAVTPIVYEPVTLTWPNGWTLDLTRDGDLVTGVLTSSGSAGSSALLLLPVEFRNLGATQIMFYDAAKMRALQLDASRASALAPATPAGVVLTAQWVAAPAPGTGVPPNWVYAQLQQAKNLLLAGSVGRGGEYGEGEFSFEPRPLDKAIKNLIRPVDGKPHAL